MTNITGEAWLTIIAVLLGPILALTTQRILDRLRQDRQRKIQVYKALMTTRATPLSPQHVEALNTIDVEFYPPTRKNKKVIEAWKDYSEHLNSFPRDRPQTESDMWGQKRGELLNALLTEMAISLHYSFDRVMLKRNAYYPEAYGNIEEELHALRKAALQVFAGERPMSMKIIGPVDVTENQGETMKTIMKPPPGN